MAKLYYDAAGNVLALRRTDAEDAAIPAPAAAAGSLSFDEATNQAVIDSLNGQVAGYRWQDHAVSGGQLLRKGVALALAADGGTRASLDGLLNAAAAAVASNQTYLGLGSPTNAQVVAQVRALTQQVNAVIKRLVILNRLTG